MNIRIDRNSSLPLYVQIKNAIREMIVSDLLLAGQKLPPERKPVRIPGRQPHDGIKRLPGIEGGRMDTGGQGKRHVGSGASK